jgi:hypothetical protein
MALSVMVDVGSAPIGIGLFPTLLFAAFGLFNPMYKGELLTTFLVLFALCGFFADQF